MLKKYLKTGIVLLMVFLNPVFSQVKEPTKKIEKEKKEWIKKTNQNIEKYRKGKALINLAFKNGVPVDIEKVTISQVSQDFLFGAIIFDLVRGDGWTETQKNHFKSRFKDIFNYATFPFYWGPYEKQAGHPDWQSNQEVIEWCHANHITMKGHPLGWTHQAGMPEWMYNFPYKLANDFYKTRVYQTVYGLQEHVKMWDVVNEAPHTVNWRQALKISPENHDKRYRTDIPLDSIAPWVEQSHRWAHEANPDAQLVVNDFEQIADKKYRQRFYDFVKLLQERETPMHGIGIQAHEPRQMWYPPEEVWNTLNLYQEFGVPLHITEIIYQSGGKEITGGWREGTWDENAQAEAAEELYRLCFGHPSVESINWWGFYEPDAWLEGGGLVDENFNPKPVYKRLQKLIKEEWMTNLNLHDLSDGSIEFNGFYGKYRVRVMSKDGMSKEFYIHLRKNEENKWNFKL